MTASAVPLRTGVRAVAVLAAFALIAGVLAALPRAQADEHVQRIDGDDRFETAAAIAADTFDADTTDVIIAAGFRFPDSLAANALAGLVDAPILLVNEVRDMAMQATLDALDALDPDTLHIAGGTAAVSAAVEAELDAAGDWEIVRYPGSDRYHTAALMAGEFEADDVDTVLVATGEVAADSLAAGPLAYHAGYPILLTRQHALPEVTADALEALDPDNVIILGGERAVSLIVAAHIGVITGALPDRLAGADRAETAVEIAEYALDNYGDHFDVEEVSLATGWGPTRHSPHNVPVPADALAGGPYGGEWGTAILPINDVLDRVPDATCDFLFQLADAIELLTVFGGPAAVSDDVVNEAVACTSPHDLTLMATTEVHAHLRAWDYYNDEEAPTLGLSKAFTLIEEAREEHDNTLLFDTGDILQGAFIGEFVATIMEREPEDVHPVIAAMNLMDYDSLTLGNHEFDFGLDFLHETLDDANFPAISANVFTVDDEGDIDEYLYDPYIVVDTEVDEIPLSIGVIGITPPGIMTWHADALEGEVDTIPAIEAIGNVLPELEAEGVDLVVLSAHAGKRLELGPDATINPEGENWLWFAAEEFADDIDAIVFGHEQSVFPGDAKYTGVEGLDNEVGLIHGIPSVMAGAFGNHLGLVHLSLIHHAGEWSVADGWAENIPVTAETEEHEAIVDAVEPHHSETVDYVNSPVGTTEVPIAHFFSRVLDTKGIELINEAQMWWAEDELAGTEWEDLPILSAAAPFRAGRVGPDEFTHIEVGDVTIRELADLYIYPNQARIVQLDGEQVIDWLDHAARNFNQIDPDDTDPQELVNGIEPFDFDVIDGIEYEIDVTQPVGERIVNATFEGDPLDETMEFAVVTNDYRAGGGGNFPHLDGTHTIVSSDMANRAILVEYFLEVETITEAQDYNWSILPVETEGTVYFRTSPDAEAYATDHDVPSVDFLEVDGDGWARFAYLFEDIDGD